MALRPKHNMSVRDRAKQFMPFAALKGLPQALAAKEKIRVPKPILSPEKEEELDRQMHLLKKGTMASVIYFHADEYLKITGLVARIDTNCRFLQIVNTKIPFDAILDLMIV